MKLVALAAYSNYQATLSIYHHIENVMRLAPLTPEPTGTIEKG